MSAVRAEDDAPLLARLRAQERGAFDELYARHHERIWAFLLRLTGRRDEAEDLFQETWVKAARHVHRLEEGARQPVEGLIDAAHLRARQELLLGFAFGRRCDLFPGHD